jgi:hypothetical protein
VSTPAQELVYVSGAKIGARRSRLLDAFGRAGVWPDSVQASGGMLSLRLPTGVLVWLSFGLHTAGRRVEAWLQRGLPSS